MKKITFFLGVMVALVASSCSSVKVSSTGKTLEPEITTLRADLDVKYTKVKGVYDINVKKNEHVDIKAMCNNAVFNALDPVGADFLVGPQFKVDIEVRGRKYITVTVTGYPAYYKNFHQDAEPQYLESYDIQELKPGTPYLVIDKDQYGGVMGYDLIAPKAPKCCEKKPCTIDLNETTVDKIILNHNGKVTPKPEQVVEVQKPTITSRIEEKVTAAKQEKAKKAEERKAKQAAKKAAKQNAKKK